MNPRLLKALTALEMPAGIPKQTDGDQAKAEDEETDSVVAKRTGTHKNKREAATARMIRIMIRV